MRTRTLLPLALVVVASAGLAWWLLDRQAQGDAVSDALALPGFAARVESVNRVEVLGAGAATLVLIEKSDGVWRMPDRDGWPANQREVGSALFRLGQAKRLEAKTADPKRHARLGVEDVAAPDAKGSQLRLSGGGADPVQVTVGNNHPSLGGSYVRIGDDPQAWLLDEDIAPARSAPDWLDRRLLDVPMARIDVIRVTPGDGPAFRLSRVDDRFSVDGLPPTAMANPDAGNATGGFTDQLALDDVAKDSGTAATQTALFESFDGLRFTVAAWPQDGGTWARLTVELDEARARDWFARPQADAAGEGEGGDADDAKPVPSAEQRLADLRSQVDTWQKAFAGRQFLLPPHKAEGLMRSRGSYLDGTP
ncbi:MAG: DUF4340 domain-containing protein [Arenimonas sp.]|nr:DUF4340 domain-containing protein [Arenimonas sp.]